jgi:hypothetical protein
MTTAPNTKPVHAPSVSRLLGNAGFYKSETHASSMVRGWHTRTAGFVVQRETRYGQDTGYKDVPTGNVLVSYSLGSSIWTGDKHDAAVARSRAKLAEMRSVIESAGYATDMKSDDEIIVTR